MFWRITSANNRPAFRLACLIRSSFVGAEAALWGSSSSNCPVLHPIPSIWATIAFRNAQSPWSFQLRRDFTRYANRLITLSTWPKGKIGKSYAYEIRRFFLGGHIVNSLISQHFGHFRLPKMTSKLSNSGGRKKGFFILFFRIPFRPTQRAMAILFLPLLVVPYDVTRQCSHPCPIPAGSFADQG